ncbi:MAG: YceI family protein [Mariniphaga sp.]|nr:YceI family protein [Mariniphaga sp.]
MKQFNLFFLFLLLYISSVAQETWTIDNAHSNIRFEVGWEDFSIRTGEFKVFEGNIITSSKEDLSDATFYLKVDPKSVEVIAENLSEQLRGERFFDAENFPEITFSSSMAKATSDSTYISSGKLTVNGVEKDQDAYFRVKGFKKGRRSYLFGLEVTIKLNRTDFGLDWGSPRLGETIKVVGHLLYQMRIEE